jgi:type IV secretion system protein TrbF
MKFGFKRQEDARNKKQGEANPYIATQKMWNDHVGEIVSSKNLWQFTGLLSLLIALACVAGLAYTAGQSKFVPFVVQVDKFGQTMAAGAVQPTSDIPVNVIGAALADFVQKARMVSPDVALQRKAVFDIFAHLNPNDPATQEMNDWMNGTPDSNPFTRASKEIVSTKIVSVLAKSPSTWQIQWKEITRDRDGVLVGVKNMESLLTMYVAPPNRDTTQEQMLRNPLGIFIKNFSWNEVQ